LDWLPAEYESNYDEADAFFFGHNASNNIDKRAPKSISGDVGDCRKGRAEFRDVRGDAGDGVTTSRKRPWARGEPATQENINDRGNQLKRARHAVTSNTPDIDYANADDEDSEHAYTCMKHEDIKVQIIDNSESITADSREQTSASASPRPRRPSPIPDMQLQPQNGSIQERTPHRVLDDWFTNMDSVRAEFSALRDENARLKEELREERERREQAERAVARVRMAVS